MWRIVTKVVKKINRSSISNSCVSQYGRAKLSSQKVLASPWRRGVEASGAVFETEDGGFESR
jgi:hypothetical protein